MPPNENENENNSVSKIYILIENPSKSNNLGPILRCGAAFAATFIFIGYEKCSVEGSHGASKHVTILSFPTIHQAVTYLRDVCHVTSVIGILGDASFTCGSDDDGREVVEYVAVNGTRLVKPSDTDINCKNITAKEETSSDETTDQDDAHSHSHPHSYPMSHPIHTRPFEQVRARAGNENGNVCFSMSKRHGGLPVEQARHCDMFVHIPTDTPVYPPEGGGEEDEGDESEQERSRPLLSIGGLVDSQTCLSICLHHYTAFAKYQERDFVGQKFEVESRTWGCNEERMKRVREERRLQREREQEEVEAAAAEKDEEGELLEGYGYGTGGLFD